MVQAKIDDEIKRVLQNDSRGTTGFREVFIRSATTRQAIDERIDELNSRRSGPPYLRTCGGLGLPLRW